MITNLRVGVLGLLVALAANSAAASACNITPPQGASGGWFVGGEQDGSTVLYGSKASISVMSPVSPVYTAGGSSVWVSLENHQTCPSCLAQVGWLVSNVYSQPTIFVQYTDQNGNYSPLYTYNQATAGPYENFQVQYVDDSSGNPQSFGFQWNEGGSGTTAYWKPYNVQTFGEAHDYSPCSPINCGSQAVGSQTNQVFLESIGYTLKSGTTYNANLNYNTGAPRTPFQSSHTYSGNSWATWDARCSS